MRQLTLLDFIKPKRALSEVNEFDELKNLIPSDEVIQEEIESFKDIKIVREKDGIRFDCLCSYVVIPYDIYMKFIRFADDKDPLDKLVAIKAGDSVFVFYKKNGVEEASSIKVNGIKDYKILNPTGEVIELDEDQIAKLKALEAGRLPITFTISVGDVAIELNYEDAITYIISKKGRRPVILGVPIEVQMLIVPEFAITKWRVKWLTPNGNENELTGMLHEILSFMKQNAMIANKAKAEDVVAIVFNELIKQGYGTIDIDYDKPGFFMINDKIKAIGFDVEKPSSSELRSALKLLDELVTKWYADRMDKFVTLIKWGLVAPFSFIMKKLSSGKDIVFPWVYLWGQAASGKTTMARIVLMMWGLGDKNIVGGSMIDTVPRFGQIVSSTTFPIVVNEVVLEKPDVIDAIKASIESTVARGKFVAGNYISIPALASMIFTSNRAPPQDAGFMRRFIIMNFTPKDKIDDQAKKEFQKVIDRAEILKALGKFSAYYIINKLSVQTLANTEWHKLAEMILAEAFREAGMPRPHWLQQLYRDAMEKEDTTIDIVAGKLKQLVIECLMKLRAVWKGNLEDENLAAAIEVIALSGLCPYFAKPKVFDYVYITSMALKEINKVLDTQLSMKALAEILDGELVKVKGRTLIKIDIGKLVEFMSVD